jgi:hypothetical protein
MVNNSSFHQYQQNEQSPLTSAQCLPPIDINSIRINCYIFSFLEKWSMVERFYINY